MIQQFFAYYRPYKGLFYLDFGCAVIVGMLELGFRLAINQFIDNLLPSKNWPLIILAKGESRSPNFSPTFLPH